MLGLIVIAVLLLGAALIFAEMRPGEMEFQRNIVIDAPPESVFPLVGDFQSWPRWQPLDIEDPTLRRVYSPITAGKGAQSQWQSKSSTGRAQIIEYAPPSMIMVAVDFTRPFSAHNVNTFTLAPAHSGTSLTWTMRGDQPFIVKLMSLVVNVDKAMGKHFEDGLRNLKAVAEGQPQQSLSGSSLNATSDGGRTTDK
jgi:uncharacterized protein YndB with AHSA1/START domain